MAFDRGAIRIRKRVDSGDKWRWRRRHLFRVAIGLRAAELPLELLPCAFMVIGHLLVDRLLQVLLVVIALDRGFCCKNRKYKDQLY